MQQHILIAGAGKGIGLELVKQMLVTENNIILAVSRDISQLRILAEKVNTDAGAVRLIPLASDLAKPDFTKVLEEALAKFSFKPEIVVYNVGLLVNKPFAALSISDFNQMFDANIKGAFSLFQFIIPHLAEGAHLLGISSMGAFQGSAKFPGLSLYSASKAALAVLMECLAEELKDYGIRSNALALGAVQTEMLAKAFPGYKAPLSAGEMASFIADFAVNGSKFFNGKILPVSVSTP
ncbi:MAG: SDR family NAD(P)-dependent oxidoreductase [Bacteroidales bacterium]|jgi:NAD(P)-dependent dehydrogenase (short-subunit alcohol dehydrogenase family)|nr:SDR family NAD(P)-dependent oxidoreductase [Bacteroidales bacterium]